MRFAVEGYETRLLMYFRYSEVDDFDVLSRAKRVKERIMLSTGEQVLEGIQKKQRESGKVYAGMGSHVMAEYADALWKKPIYTGSVEGTEMII